MNYHDYIANQPRSQGRGPTENPIDFPTSWSYWRHYSQHFYGYDPGPNEAEATDDLLRELQDLLADLRKETDKFREAIAFAERFTRAREATSRKSRGVEL